MKFKLTFVLIAAALLLTACPPVNQRPIASFTVTPPQGDTTTGFSFDATGSSDPDGGIVGYAWEFGDGNTESGVTVTHQFAMADTFQVTLTVTDNQGATASMTQEVVVTQPPGFGLSLTATVGTVAGECATESQITAIAGSVQTVFYCYTITNTGEVAIPLHTLADTQFGVILRDFAFDLAPGASVNTVAAGVTLSTTLTTTTVNSAVWEGFIGDRRVASAEAQTTVTFVPPLEYGALAGTFVANSNSPTISAFDGNILFIGIRNFDGTPITESVVVNITVPDIGSFPYTFDPNEAIEGVIGFIIRDFAAGLGPAAAGDNGIAQALSRSLGIPVEVVTLERPAFAPQAAVGGEFVFSFPGQTITRTVNAAAKLVVPAVTNVVLNDARTELTVTFNESGAGVGYLLTAFGRGLNAHTGSTPATSSPAIITLSGALEPGERYVVDVTAVRGEVLDLFGAPQQIDIGQHLHYSE